ncbi:MAG TPA: PQQ-dependent sugar dehydrogenase [Saprospiraceae bacterium]|nr:PQQ-dependent sugar dehydrogenase [Saprospiraceae bacterium]HMQ82448.1 PQQ-dependent sugar dehydrogenase [Saprospiraceae bacterium]
MKNFFLLAGLLYFLPLRAQLEIELNVFANGFDSPVDISHAGDDRLFITEKDGTIRIIDGNGNVLPQPFLNIDPMVNSQASERGLLGLAFHPDYSENGYFYVNYTNGSGHTVIARYSVSAGNPNQADPNSELPILTINQPFSNHNAGDLNFGPDGYLYIAMGDGGSGGDPQNNSQTRNRMLGKMLRLDVDNVEPYTIPADNPFINDNLTLDEIWAIGLRNPWRFSFDRLTGDIWIADVGQDDWEEIHFQPASSTGGENYGWRCYEGFDTYNTNNCGGASGYVQPVHVYPSDGVQGCSITGGYVYRGENNPSMYGYYFYADYCTGRFWGLRPDGQGGWSNVELLNLANQEFSSFGEDAEGELYVAGIGSGNIYQVVAACVAPAAPIISGDEPILCEGQSLLLTASAAPDNYHYAWYINGLLVPNVTGSELEVTENVTVQAALVADDGSDCNSPLSQGYDVTNFVTLPEIDILIDGLEISGPGGYATYQWYLDGNPIPGANAATYLAESGGSYSLEVTDENGCSASSAELTLVSALDIPGVKSLLISPNPIVDQVQLSLQVLESGLYEFQLLQAEGRALRQKRAKVDQRFDFQWDLSTLPAGFYLLRIKCKGGEWTQKIQKQ